MLLPATNTRSLRRTEPGFPSWVTALLDDHGGGSSPTAASGDTWDITSNERWSAATIRLDDAAKLDPGSFQRAVAGSYLQLLDILQRHAGHQPVRFWNYVPQMLEPAGPDGDRYMLFNAGRHEALAKHLGDGAMEQCLVAASAVDGGGDDFQIHVLACKGAVRSLENPRQRPAYRYSSRYGPVPPSFARATIVDAAEPGEPIRLISAGTASVLGEDSQHHHDLARQLRETEINLAVLAAQAVQGGRAVDVRLIEGSLSLRRELLAACVHVRGYVARGEDEAAVAMALRETFTGAAVIELMPATLCRRDLLVEVEVMAEFDGTGDAETPGRQ